MITTRYYEEFLRYFKMAYWQHENCNLGSKPHADMPFDDDLMKQVHLYDVVERKYAGFSQLLLDMWYPANGHPYGHKASDERKAIVDSFNTYRNDWGMYEWLFIFMVHRLTGSGINYASSNSGYHNSILLKFNECRTIHQMCQVIKNHKGPKYTSQGYQIAPFPKIPDSYNGTISKGGDWFICQELPRLILNFEKFLTDGGHKKSFRSLALWLEKYNQNLGFRVFRFQYGAFLADIADFMPSYIDEDSHYFYGKNASECLSYLAINDNRLPKLEFQDAIMDRIRMDTGMLPYNAEDVACDFIRWVENYINPKLDYSHICMDSVWSSHKLIDHPYGRQKPMLELGLVQSFNNCNNHPSDDTILKSIGMSVDEYKYLTRIRYGKN